MFTCLVWYHFIKPKYPLVVTYSQNTIKIFSRKVCLTPGTLKSPSPPLLWVYSKLEFLGSIWNYFSRVVMTSLLQSWEMQQILVIDPVYIYWISISFSLSLQTGPSAPSTHSNLATVHTQVINWKGYRPSFICSCGKVIFKNFPFPTFEGCVQNGLENILSFQALSLTRVEGRLFL